MSQSDTDDPTWIDGHRDIWARKAGLRNYYQREIFARIESRLRDGPMLELGSGPGFFAHRHPDAVCVDVTPGPRTTVRADAHALPFRDGSFDNVVGIDVLHHLRRPADAVGEALRVLRPNGRLILVEPWTGPLGRLFYRYLHHEGCAPLADPMGTAFPGGKSPMDGNATIPRTLFVAQAEALGRRFPTLRIREVTPFGALSYLLTGGFQRWGAPSVAIRALTRAEAYLPVPLVAAIATRVLLVAEHQTD